MWGIKKIAEILFIVIVLFIILFMVMGYGTLLKESIMKLLGWETESEITEEQNLQAKRAFENLEKQIKKCQDSTDDDCRCLVDLRKFGNNYKINFSNNEVKLLNLKNIRKGEEGLQMGNFDMELNCYWDKNLKENTFTKIIFNPEPFILKERKVLWNIKYKFTDNFNLLKINKKLCWLTDQVKEDKISQYQRCQ